MDEGCPQVAPRCLECPLELCRHDDEAGYKRWERRERDAKVRELVKAGASYGEIAAQTGVTERTVFRVMARAENAKAQEA